MNEESRSEDPKPKGGRTPDALAEADRLVGEIYLRHSGDVMRFVKKELGLSQEDAEDLVPLVFLKLTRRFREGNPPATPLNWLFEVARNEGLHLIRKEERDADFASLGADGIPSDVVDRSQRRPESKLMSAEVKAITREALLGLPEPSRRVVMLHLDGASCPEIAKALGIPEDRAERICLDAERSVQDRLGQALSSLVREADSRDYTPRTRAKMLEALEMLGRRYAEILRLRHEEGLDLRRVAARLGTTQEQLDRDLKRAHELLHRRFKLTPEGLEAILRKPV
jgi:RNA polymerase sigma factor (sigma-70 family)